MVNERRQHPRIAVPMDGRWLGDSGGTTCQVENISLGGCFVRTSAPSVEGMGVLRLIFGRRPLSIAGRIVHAERGRGFGMKFQDVSADVRSELMRYLEELKSARVA
ncbi:MAG TPA: PilZ domain-containing protein [Vicinamibacterales bacterium]|nr:PilZ domain-containing protein [Vicinamibacterales bacterium]